MPINTKTNEVQSTVALASAVLAIPTIPQLQQETNNRISRRELISTNLDKYLAHHGNPEDPIYNAAVIEINSNMVKCGANDDKARVNELREIARLASMNVVSMVLIQTDSYIRLSSQWNAVLGLTIDLIVDDQCLDRSAEQARQREQISSKDFNSSKWKLERCDESYCEAALEINKRLLHLQPLMIDDTDHYTAIKQIAFMANLSCDLLEAASRMQLNQVNIIESRIQSKFLSLADAFKNRIPDLNDLIRFKIRNTRQKKGLTQSALAKSAEVSTDFIVKLEKYPYHLLLNESGGKISIGKFLRVIRAMSVNPFEFFDKLSNL